MSVKLKFTLQLYPNKDEIVDGIQYYGIRAIISILSGTSQLIGNIRLIDNNGFTYSQNINTANISKENLTYIVDFKVTSSLSGLVSYNGIYNNNKSENSVSITYENPKITISLNPTHDKVENNVKYYGIMTTIKTKFPVSGNVSLVGSDGYKDSKTITSSKNLSNDKTTYQLFFQVTSNSNNNVTYNAFYNNIKSIPISINYVINCSTDINNYVKNRGKVPRWVNNGKSCYPDIKGSYVNLDTCLLGKSSCSGSSCPLPSKDFKNCTTPIISSREKYSNINYNPENYVYLNQTWNSQERYTL
jgi:hypothetical protein